MRFATAALVALAVSPAAAETVTSVGSPCEVRFVRAPDDVRHVIESWLAAEPRCQGSIDLRVLPIEGGYYLFAQRPDGRIHERVVPDAQSAGVLVASWVADDWTAQPPRPPVVAPRPVIVNPLVGPENALGASAPSSPRVGTHWLSLTGMVNGGQGSSGGGIRTEFDVYRRAVWSVSGALSISTLTGDMLVDGNMTPYATEDFRVVGLLNRTVTFGRWEARFAAGVGVLHTSAGFDFSNHNPNQPWPTNIRSLQGAVSDVPIVETAITLSRRFATNWSAAAGVVLDAMDQNVLTTDGEMPLVRRDAELMFTGGLRYAL